MQTSSAGQKVRITMNGRFTVTNHDYVNTGGNTMVSIFAVYDKAENNTKFVLANEDGFNWQTADTISNSEVVESDEMYDKILLGCWDWSALTTEPTPLDHQFTEDEFELFTYCRFEYYKKDCKYFNNKVCVPIDQLPNNLYKRLTADYIEWAKDNMCGVETDGYDIFLNENYEPPTELDKELADVKDFKRWFDLIKYEEPDTDHGYITVALLGNSVKIPLHADSYYTLDNFLSAIIDDWEA